MNRDQHERARQLSRAARVEGITRADGAWLDAHLAGCDACARDAAALDEAIRSLRSAGVAAPADMVRRTTLAVRRRAEQRQAGHESAGVVWVAVAISVAWAILTTPYVWA